MRVVLRALARSVWLLSVLISLSACQSELYTGLPEQEANEMLALLQHGGLSVGKVPSKDGTDSITVEPRQFADAIDLLRGHGLPRAKFSSINEVFQPNGLIASPIQEQARYLWALGQELSNTVSQIDGVLAARVQVVLPDNDLMKRAPTPSSASVFVRYDSASAVASLVPQIKMLVANSVQGLSYDKVSVVMVPVPHEEMPLPSSQPADTYMQTLFGAAAAALLIGVLVAFQQSIRKLIQTLKPQKAIQS